MPNSPRILVLEDDPRMLSMLEDALRVEGFDVVCASRGEEAVEEMIGTPFDLIVADIRMEGMSGLDAVEQGRRHQPDLGTVIISGYATPENTARANEIQAGRILKKPFGLDEFLHRVREELKRVQRHLASGVRAKSYQSSLMWALELIAEVMNEEPGPVASSFYSRLGESLALAVGLSEEVAREVGLACCFARPDFISRFPAEFLEDATTLPTFKYCLQNFGTRDDVHQELEIVRFVVHAIDEEGNPDAPYTLPEELADKVSNTKLLELYQEILLGQNSGPRQKGPVEEFRHLLSLAHALREIGQTEAASAAYLRIAAQSSGSAYVGAQLGLARIAVGKRCRSEVEELCQKALNEAKKLGPLSYATCQLEAGLLGFESGDESPDLLKEAALNLARLGFDGSVALATIALLELGVSMNPGKLMHYLRALSEPRYFDEVWASRHWLIPTVLRLLPGIESREQVQALIRLLSWFPNQVARRLKEGNLPPETRKRLAECLGGFGIGASGIPIVDALKADSDPSVAECAHKITMSSQGDDPMTVLRLRSFGVFQVFVGSDKVSDKAWRTKKVRYYLAYLASDFGRFLSEDMILELFWPDNDRDRAKQNLYWTNSAVRRALSRSGAEFSVDLIERRDESLRLNPELEHWHDVQEFESVYEKGKRALSSGEYHQARNNFSRMAELYQGPYLDGQFSDWAIRRREELEQKALGGFLGLGACCLELKDPLSALEASQRALTLDPSSQKGHLLAMKAYLAKSEPQKAMEVYEACHKLLADEYGLQPGNELQALYEVACQG